jgi:Ca2+-transporting ATPase
VTGASIEKARTVAVNTFVIMELFYLFNCRSMRKSIFQLGIFTNMWAFGGVAVMLLIQLVYTYLPLMHRLFQSAAIGIESWIRIMLAGLVAYLIVELEKKLRCR